MTAGDLAGLSPDERRLLEEAVARGLLTEAACEALLARRERQEDGSLQPISQVLLLERAIAVPDYLALKRALAENDSRAAPPRQAAFGPYRVVREIARARFTAVFEGEDPQRRRVAVKALLSLTDAASAKRKRLEAEVRALMRVAHPGIVRVHGAANENGVPYFVMDLVAGATLEQLLRERGRLDPVEAASLVAKAADAMAHAHSRGVLHRDLKPANVIVAGPPRDAQPVIVGLGLAKVLGFETRVTRPGEVLGTPAYVAPESVRPELGTLGPGADVYALGAIAFELVAGRPPFQAASVGELLVKVLEEAAPALDAVRPGVSPGLARTIARALEKRPGERLATAAELATALRESARESARLLVADVPVAAVPATPSAAPAASPPRKSRVKVRALAGLVALAVEAPFLLLLGWQGVRGARLEAASAALERAAAALVHGSATYRSSRDRAEELATKGDLDGAIAALASAQAARPASPEPLARRARLEARAGLAVEARRTAESALALLPERSSSPERRADRRMALLAHAEASLDLDEPAVALRDLDRAAALEEVRDAVPLDAAAAETFARRAQVRALLGDTRGAEADLERSGAAPGPLRALAEAALLTRDGAHDRALLVLTVAREASPDEPALAAARGALLLDARRFREAVLEVETLPARAPRSGRAALLAARAHAAAGHWLRALRLRERARSLGRDDAELDARLDVVQGLRPPRGSDEVADRAAYLVEQGNPREARMLVERELAENPSQPLERALFVALAAQGLQADALPLAERLAEADGPPAFHRARAQVLVRAHRFAAAEQACDRAVGQDPEDADSYLLRANVRRAIAYTSWSSAPRFEAVVADARAAVAAGVHDAGEAELLAAEGLLLLGRTGEATAACARAVRVGARVDAVAFEAGRGLPVASERRTPLADAERARVEALEIGDDEGWEALGNSYVRPALGGGHLYGRSAVAIVAARAASGAEAGVAFPDAAWRRRAATVGQPGAFRVEHDLGRGLRFKVAVRPEDLSVETPRLGVALVLVDAAGASRRLAARELLVADGAWHEVHVPLEGGEPWSVASRGSLDARRIVRIEVRLQTTTGGRLVAWLDGLRPD